MLDVFLYVPVCSQAEVFSRLMLKCFQKGEVIVVCLILFTKEIYTEHTCIPGPIS